MYRRLFLLSYFVILFQIPLSFGTITKHSPRDFVVERNGETANIKIEGITGIIEYFAEVKHKNPQCLGCRMYLIRTSEGKYYLHHKKNKMESADLRTLMGHIQNAGSRTSAGVLFIPGMAVPASYYGLPCHLHDRVDVEMQTTLVPNLSQRPNGEYQIVTGPDITISEYVVVGDFKIVEEITF